ncbi:MAG: SurA N-terminal domain-containing protein [Longimicrobiales bacterium]
MMRTMRENTVWIMIVTALAFVALMVFDWGMDITGQTAGSFGEIGRVNGTPVMYDPYIATYRNLYNQLQDQQEEPITNLQNTELEDRAWDEIVNSILIQQELRRRGIVVTDEEVVEAARFSPPPELLSSPVFATDGQFDQQKYQQFVATADNQTLLQLEAYYRDVIPRGKLLRQVASGIYLSEAELWMAFKDANEEATARFVSFDPLTRVNDDQIEISAQEVESYYDANREDFAVPATARVVSVSMTKTPTAADTANVMEEALAIRQEILDGGDFAEVAQRTSTDESTSENGGSLGVFPKARMVPAFDSVVFQAALNRITEPVKTQFGVHLIEVTERWGQDSAAARHILLPFERTDDSEIALLALADSVEELSESMTLTEAAIDVGLPTDTLDVTENFPLIPGAGQVAEGGEWAFDPETSPGDVSPVFENATSFYGMELISVDPAGYLTVEEAEGAIRQTIGVEKKTTIAVSEAEEFLAQVSQGRSLDEVAREYALEVREAGPFSRADFWPGLGRQNAAVGALFGLEVGETSSVIQANQNAFILERTDALPADSTVFVEQLDLMRAQSVNAVQQQRLAQWIEALRESADIVDRRDDVLNQTEEENTVQVPRMF